MFWLLLITDHQLCCFSVAEIQCFVHSIPLYKTQQALGFLGRLCVPDNEGKSEPLVMPVHKIMSQKWKNWSKWEWLGIHPFPNLFHCLSCGSSDISKPSLRVCYFHLSKWRHIQCRLMPFKKPPYNIDTSSYSFLWLLFKRDDLFLLWGTFNKHYTLTIYISFTCHLPTTT